MDFNYDIPNVRTGTNAEQREVVGTVPTYLINTGESPVDDIYEFTREVTREQVPIYELRAEEEARAKLKNHEEDAEFEELVSKVKELEAFMADKDEIYHKAMAVILDDQIMFDELKRSHKVLDFTYAYITKEANKWEQHESAYDSLLADIQMESEKCEEAKRILSKLM